MLVLWNGVGDDDGLKVGGVDPVQALARRRFRGSEWHKPEIDESNSQRLFQGKIRHFSQWKSFFEIEKCANESILTKADDAFGNTIFSSTYLCKIFKLGFASETASRVHLNKNLPEQLPKIYKVVNNVT